MKPVKLFNCVRFLLTFSICLLPCCSGQAHSEVCEGECKPISQCRRIAQNFELYASQNKIKYCNIEDSIVCCTKRRRPPTINIRADSRIFVQKCAEFNETIHKKYPCPTTPLIIAGTKADPKEFPFMALLGIKRANENPNWICGGTLISTNFVITASHCLTNLKPNDLIVRLGELDHSRNDDDANPEDFNVVNIISNPNYDLDRFDAAILELDREVTFNEYIKPACLPWTSGDEYDDLVATGWGDQGGAKFSSHLLKVNLERFNAFDCSVAEENYDEPTQICVGSRTDRRDTCNGDSGGPLFVKHPNFPCLHVLVGITSKGRECGLKGTPALYTRVHLFVRWIEQVIWDARADLGYQRPG